VLHAGPGSSSNAHIDVGSDSDFNFGAAGDLHHGAPDEHDGTVFA
jgi:hypothetical protein